MEMIYDPLSGILNFVLKSSHIISQNISWLGDKLMLKIMIILYNIYWSTDYPYIAAMGNIDNSLVEQRVLTVRLNFKSSGRSNG